MKTKEILEQRHTFLYNVSGYAKSGYIQKEFKLKHLLIDIPEQLKQYIFKLRELGYQTKLYDETKKQFPNWVVSGTYPYKQINDESTQVWSNIISIDIDKKDNNIDLEIIREKLFNLPYVFAVLKSISGLGYYALILVEDGKFTKEYYTYIAKLWNKQYGLNIDTHCKNISRKRFIGYDENVKQWIKPDETEIIPWKLKYIEKKEEKIIKHENINISKYKEDKSDYEITSKAIWKLLNDGFSIDDINGQQNYGIWYHIACDYHHFEDGLNMFISFSNNSTKYKDKQSDIIKKYNNAKIETDFDTVARKWCGICKRKYGKEWYRQLF